MTDLGAIARVGITLVHSLVRSPLGNGLLVWYKILKLDVCTLDVSDVGKLIGAVVIF